MANELIHKTVGTSLSQAEFEDVLLHQFNSQATGDLPYASSATQLSRLGIGTTNKILKVVSGLPSWQSQHFYPQSDTNCQLYLPLYDWDLGIASPIISKDSNRYSCAITGTVWSALGRAFDGDDFVNLNALVTPLAATTVGTWSGWFKLTPFPPASDASLISFSDTDVAETIYMHVSAAGSVEATCYDAGSLQWDIRSDSTTLLAPGVFTWITVIHDGVAPILRVNGVTVASTFINQTDKTKWFAACTGIDNGRLGCLFVTNSTNSAWLTGSEAEVIIWKDVRTVTEDTDDYLATRWRYS